MPNIHASPALAPAPDPNQKRSTTEGASGIWHLDRLDQRELPLDGTYTYADTATGLALYQTDTGALYNHVEWTGNGRSINCVLDTIGGTSPSCNDCAGHGTNTLSLAAGVTYGVAKTAGSQRAAHSRLRRQRLGQRLVDGAPDH